MKKSFFSGLIPYFLFAFFVPYLAAQNPSLDEAKKLLTPQEIAQFDALVQQRRSLGDQIASLDRALQSVQNNYETFLTNSNESIVKFADGFYDYKVDRILFATRLTRRIARDLVQKTGLNTGILEKIEEDFAQFEEAAKQVPRLSEMDQSNKREYQQSKNKSADAFDSINPPHRRMIDHALILLDELRQSGKINLTDRLMQALANLLRPVNQSLENVRDRFLKNLLSKKMPIFPTIKNILEIKYSFNRYTFPSQLTGFNQKLEPGQVNFIIAPHGGPEEVAFTAARIVTALPPGRKASVLLAAYHFVPPTPQGLELANLIASHPDFIAVLAESSPFKDQVKNAPVDIQIAEAAKKGVTDFIIFSEGRNTSRGGGFTPANLNTMRLLRMITRQKMTKGGVDYAIQPMVTMVSANFSNLQFGIGVGRDPLYVGVDHFFDFEATARLAKSPAEFAALFDVVWNLRAIKINRNRLGSTASEEQILQEIWAKYTEFDLVCPELSFIQSAQ